MQSVPVSIFSYEKDLVIEKTTKKNNTFKEAEKPPGEHAILAILYKYGFMNMEMVKKALDLRGNTYVDAQKGLESLQKLGKVDKYTIQHPNKLRADIDIYTLSEKVYGEYLENKKEKPLYRRDFTNIPYLMESLAATQWHINVLGNRKKFKKESTEIMYNHPQITNNGIVQIPSLIRIKYVRKRGMYLCGIPVNRDYDLISLKKFIVKVAKIDKYFIENADKYYSYTLIIICESINQIEEVSKLFEVMEETQCLNLLYTIDMVTSKIDPLSHLYEVKRTAGKASITLVEL